MFINRLLISGLLIVIFTVACADFNSEVNSSSSRDDSNVDTNAPTGAETGLASNQRKAEPAVIGYSKGDIAPKFSLRTSNESIITSGQLLNEYEGVFILFYIDS